MTCRVCAIGNGLETLIIRRILTLNSGSSSLKATLFDRARVLKRRDFRYAGIGTTGLKDHQSAIEQLLSDLGDTRIDAVGHRITHGGAIADRARFLNKGEIERLRSLMELAPLHLPHNLRGVDLCARFDVPQIGCYDTSFHATISALSQRLPTPESEKLRRFGFHGLNYAHIAEQLPRYLGLARSDGPIAVAHLGNGSSLCLLKNRRSYHTSMGWSPLGGVPMGTRSGDLDPSVIFHLLKSHSLKEVENLLWNQSGLLALSNNISSQMQELLNSPDRQARFAIDFYCLRISQEIGGMAAFLGGLKALVFTGGIGENSPLIRQLICQRLAHLGFRLNHKKNRAAATELFAEKSRPIFLIKADEEHQMQKLVVKICNSL